LDQGAPLGASIDPDTGVFSWTPTATEATDQYTITVRVTDDGNPPMSATTTFTASPQGPVSAVLLTITQLTPELVTITVTGGVSGVVYNLESSTNLLGQPYPTGWDLIQTFWKGNENFTETTHSTINTTRFYRVRRGP
jgi:hypothetical protein